MEMDKWNDIWKIMKSDQLEFDTSDNNLLCTICEKLLINAHYGPCGCRYCLECITKYFNEEENICPGNTDYCKNEFIDVNQNIHFDTPMNILISKLRVKCKVCEFTDELLNIENHMRICNSRIVECPYLHMGCDEYCLDIKKHMLKEIVPHTKMLFESIDHLKNEIKLLKEDKIESKNEIENLKKCIINFQVQVEHEKKDKEDMRKYINDLESKCEMDNKEIQEKLKQTENKLDEEQGKVELLKKEIKTMNLFIESLKKNMSDNKRRPSTKIDEMNKISTDMGLILNENDKLVFGNQERENCREFVWCIDKWKEKTEQARKNTTYYVDSDVFYSHTNGYKMRLSVYPNGRRNGRGTHLNIECYVMPGECDDILPWPFKHDVTFELINQQTNHIHTSSTISYDGPEGLNTRLCDIFYNRNNQKPMDSSFICHNSQFISLKELSNNLSLIVRDRILIKCNVNK